MSDQVYLCFAGEDAKYVLAVGDLTVYFTRPFTMLERLCFRLLGWPHAAYFPRGDGSCSLQEDKT